MYFVCDIGGTKMRLASSFDGENFQDIQVFSTPQDFESAMDIIEKFVSKSGNSTQEGTKIACGLPGVFDRAKTMLVNAPNLSFWVSKPVKEKLESITGGQVFIENDASFAALGESIYGVGKGFGIVAFVTVGTGVGGARVVNGKIDPSVYGFEPGHQIINADVVVGGRMIDWEGLVSGVGIRTRYGRKAEEIKEVDVWREVERFLAIGLTNTILHWSPDIVVVGGGLMQSKMISLERIQSDISAVLKIFPKIPDLKLGTLADEAGIRGALHYLKDK
jgi:glucokinase